jgi:glycosyltransferase involved in cell wall biosynthesis
LKKRTSADRSGSTPPRISIITPSFNQGNFLEETIRSVLDQNYEHLEYIVIDGGSTDQSIDIIKKYETKLAYWVSEKDRGQSHAINKGFQVSTGEIIAWLNSDDCYLTGTLDTVSRFFQEHPHVDLLYGDVILIDRESRTLDVRKVVPYNYTLALYSLSGIPQPSAFFRRRALDVVGLLDEDLHYQMDTEFFLRFGKHRLRVEYLPVPLAKFRLHPRSKTISEYDDKVQEANRKILEKMMQRRITKKEAWKFQGLKLLARFIMYCERAVLRFDFVPFRAKRAMRRAVL